MEHGQVEDIVDTGRTAQRLAAAFAAAGAASVRLATLLDKPSRRVVHFLPDYVCFEVGYSALTCCCLGSQQARRNPLAPVSCQQCRIYTAHGLAVWDNLHAAGCFGETGRPHATALGAKMSFS